MGLYRLAQPGKLLLRLLLLQRQTSCPDRRLGLLGLDLVQLAQLRDHPFAQLVQLGALLVVVRASLVEPRLELRDLPAEVVSGALEQGYLLLTLGDLGAEALDLACGYSIACALTQLLPDLGEGLSLGLAQVPEFLHFLVEVGHDLVCLGPVLLGVHESSQRT